MGLAAVSFTKVMRDAEATKWVANLPTSPPSGAAAKLPQPSSTSTNEVEIGEPSVDVPPDPVKSTPQTAAAVPDLPAAPTTVANLPTTSTHPLVATNASEHNATQTQSSAQASASLPFATKEEFEMLRAELAKLQLGQGDTVGQVETLQVRQEGMELRVDALEADVDAIRNDRNDLTRVIQLVYGMQEKLQDVGELQAALAQVARDLERKGQLGSDNGPSDS